jgi:hypothetical protein
LVIGIILLVFGVADLGYHGWVWITAKDETAFPNMQPRYSTFEAAADRMEIAGLQSDIDAEAKTKTKRQRHARLTLILGCIGVAAGMVLIHIGTGRKRLG